MTDYVFSPISSFLQSAQRFLIYEGVSTLRINRKTTAYDRNCLILKYY